MERLSAKDICSIIHACQKHKVSRFQLESLKLEFNTESTIIDQETLKKLQIEQPELSLKEKAIQQKERLNDLLEEARLAEPRLYEELVGAEPTEEENV